MGNKKTVVRGERRIGERAGRAALALGVVALTFMNSQVGIFGLPRQTLMVVIGGVVTALGFISHTSGFKTGGFTGIVLGILIFYFTFVSQHVSRLADKVRISDYALVPYLLIVATVVAILYVLKRPKTTVKG